MGHEMTDTTAAVQQFQEIFMDDARRQDRAQWRDFFISETFLDAQYEESFVQAVHDYLRQQDIVPYTKLPDGLVVELAIVYVLQPGEQDYLVPLEERGQAAAFWDESEAAADEALEAGHETVPCNAGEAAADKVSETGYGAPLGNAGETGVNEASKAGHETVPEDEDTVDEVSEAGYAQAAKLWNSQENREKHYRELMSKASFIRRKSYDEYRTMRRVVLEDTWDYRHSSDDMEEYKFTLSMASWRFIADDDKVNSMDIDDVRLEDNITHACEVELYDYLLRKYGFPVGACAYMYKYFELENIEETEYAQVYRNLKAHILERYPDMDDFCKSNITAEDYVGDLVASLEGLRDQYKNLGWGKNFVELNTPCYATEVVAWCGEEAKQVYGIVHSPLFQKFRFEDCVVNKLIVFEFTVTQAKIFYEIYNKPELYHKNSRIMRLVHRLFGRITAYGRQEQYLVAQDYDYDLEIGSPDFWEYFLTVAAGDRSIPMDRDDAPIPWGFLYEDKMMLPAYMNCVYMPSVEWRLRFTGYNKAGGRFGDARELTLEVNDTLTVTIVFHYHYVRYFVNGEEVFLSAFDVDSLFTYAAGDDITFLLLLPIARIEYEERQRVRDRLMEILPELVRFPASVGFLAAMLSCDNASVHRIREVGGRRYIENLTDCYRLDQYCGGGQRLFRFYAKFGCWEYVGLEMRGNHFRDRLEIMLGEADDEEGWDMTTFRESDLSLPYEVETAVHDVARLKTKEKISRLAALFQTRNQGDFLCTQAPEASLLDCGIQVILVFGDRERTQLRQHFAVGVLLNREAEEKAYKEHRYLKTQMERLEKYAKKDREWQWKGWLELENYHNAVPICMGAGGSLYAHGIPYGKGTKAKDFAALLGKLICFDDLTQIIEYDIEQRSEWE